MVYCLYILASKRNGTLYIGVTNDLARRVSEHRQGAVPGFTKRYGIHLLVYYETFDDVRDAARARTGDEEMAPGLEDTTRRIHQSSMAGSLRDAQSMIDAQCIRLGIGRSA
jgi:GIY-YIG catalytic domain-containing protein